VTDGLGAAPGDFGSLAGLPGEAALRLEASRSLAEIAALVLDAAVPGFAAAASVFVLETLPENGRVAPPAGSGRLLARRLGTKIAGLAEAPKTFPPGEVLAFAADSPYARCVRDAGPAAFAEPDSHTLDQAGPGGREMMGRYASFLAVPMISHDAVTGLVAFARETAAAFTGPETMTAARLAARAGAAVDAALALMRERTLTGALQRGLLTAAPVAPPGLETAGRCLPADGHTVGGDWYDVVPTASGAAGLTVGDVMGHGPAAAALMAQLRAAAHALAGLGLRPAGLLRQLGGTAATLRHLTLATCVHAVIDPDARSCVIGAAGHLPPVLALPDGTAHVPDLPAGPSFGLDPDACYGEARLELPPGAVLALYTDGLAETRTRPFDQGIAALRVLLARHRREPLEVIADLVVESLAVSREDDVTVLLARIPDEAGA
jgi:hypothetical protein